MADDALIQDAREAFEECEAAESDNRKMALDDIKFSRLEEQWPEDIKNERLLDHRPCLTIDRTKAFMRQVVNDARQNKPSIKVRPADDSADPETADVLNGLIRNIEYQSNADVAYDTGGAQAIEGGFGYWRVDLDYAHQDAFELDIEINRIVNQFSVYGDPYSAAADSSDWNVCFVTDKLSKRQFEMQYGKASKIGWDDGAWRDATNWKDDEGVIVAEWWTRDEIEVEIVRTSEGQVFDKAALDTDPDLAAAMDAGAFQIVAERMARRHKVTQRIITGVEVLEENEWLGRYIPIVPVYGDEFNVEGKRYFRSLINPAKDAQRLFNFWRTNGAEMIALAPKVPWIGPEGIFSTDTDKWNTANSINHPFMEYSTEASAAAGGQVPQRQPLDLAGGASSAQQALFAADDMKAVLGIYDPSLGARSNETSGRAIIARQREGDVATFHFVDNLSRAIRHTGRIVLDLIPKVYTEARVLRVIGEDGMVDSVPVNQPFEQTDDDGKPVMQTRQDEQGNDVQEAVLAMHDLTVGKYDIAVDTGPSFTTRREEAATQMTEMIRAYPAAAPVIADILASNFDWPGADEIAKRFKKMREGEDALPPEVQQRIQEGLERLRELEDENNTLKQRLETDLGKISIDKYRAETERMKLNGGNSQAEADKMQVEMAKVRADMERIALDREKIRHEREMFYLQNDLEPSEDGTGGFASRQAANQEQLLEALKAMTATLVEVHRVVNSPRRAELQRDEEGRPVAAVSYPTTERPN